MEIGTTIHTVSGFAFDIANPDYRVIFDKDIAKALSRICRYGGHTPFFYSVAEHSLGVSQLAEEDGCDQDTVLACLLHDASEAYLGDVVSPLKGMLRDYWKIESRVMSEIGRRYGLDFHDHEEAIKKYDKIMLIAEMDTFSDAMPDRYKEYVSSLKSSVDPEWVKRAENTTILGLRQEIANARFLDEVDWLYDE
jgi:hypothetical protein